MRDYHPLKMLVNMVIVACVALAVSIAIANIKPAQPEGTYEWIRYDHYLDETVVKDTEIGIEVGYFQSDKPFYFAKFKSYDLDEPAYQLGIDMDQDMKVDFTIMDFDGDGYLDFDMIFCHENCEETIRRAFLLFLGELRLEKTI